MGKRGEERRVAREDDRRQSRNKDLYNCALPMVQVPTEACS